MQTLIGLESARANIFAAATKPYLFTLKYRQKLDIPRWYLIYNLILKLYSHMLRWNFDTFNPHIQRLRLSFSNTLSDKWWWSHCVTTGLLFNFLATPNIKRNRKIVGWDGRLSNDEDYERQRWVGLVIQDEKLVLSKKSIDSISHVSLIHTYKYFKFELIYIHTYMYIWYNDSILLYNKYSI